MAVAATLPATLFAGAAVAVAVPSVAAQPASAATPLAVPEAVTTVADNPPATTPGAVAGFGAAGDDGGPGSGIAKPIVGMAVTPDGHGYWVVGSDGGVFSFGDARFFGSTSGTHLAQPIVGIAATPDGNGYWLVAADGGIFSFGDARFYGSLSPESTQARVVALAADPQGGGYWAATAPKSSPAPIVAAASVSAGPDGTSIGTFVVTCYDLEGTTATGVPAGPETVAVDPSIIPLGSHIYVGGVGERVAQDTGGAIQGRRLDVWEPTEAQCAAWGVESQPVWIQA
jgi:3D (Asp-Asp-Asp) domain-containing protein